jgi:hypothetical protein
MTTPYAETFHASLKKERIYRQSWPTRAQAQAGDRRVRVHRGLVQPAAPALDAGLPVPCRVRATAQRARPTGAQGSISLNGSVAPIAPRAADGLRTRRLSTVGVDFVADGSISSENALALPTSPAQAARQAVEGRTAPGGPAAR